MARLVWAPFIATALALLQSDWVRDGCHSPDKLKGAKVDLKGFRPMLGAKVADIAALRYPLLASPKYDGIRAMWCNRQFYSRTLKPIPNRSLTQRALELHIPDGWEGELVAGLPTEAGVFARTSSRVMTQAGTHEGIKFYVFDNLADLYLPFRKRVMSVCNSVDFAVRVHQVMMFDAKQAAAYEEKCVEWGYEGIILRDPNARYKKGRSTLSEQGLLKVKRFEDGEAEVIGFEEKMHNANEAKLDERGYSKRTSHKENQQPTGVLGALVVRWQGQPLGVGSGFTDAQRASIWAAQGQHLGRFAKIKYAPTVKDLPRHPVFLGWRDERDM
jgi:DNA ligase-1